MSKLMLFFWLPRKQPREEYREKLCQDIRNSLIEAY